MTAVHTIPGRSLWPFLQKSKFFFLALVGLPHIVLALIGILGVEHIFQPELGHRDEVLPASLRLRITTLGNLGGECWPKFVRGLGYRSTGRHGPGEMFG